MTSTPNVVRVAQLSDTHFLEPGAEPEGGFAYDTAAAFDAVHGDLEAQGPFDLVAVTGDIADHGRAAQYSLAADALSTISSPVNVCPGNHDQDAAFGALLGRPGVGTSRVVEVDNWCFLFADSNSGVMVADDTGRLVDPDSYDDRLHTNGSLAAREVAWLREMCATTTADHVFIWIHHPPGATDGTSKDEGYDTQWRSLIGDFDKLRGIGGGHTHVPADYVFADVPVFVCPALKNNFDLEAGTMLPPGYRSYEFAADGTVTSVVRNVDDPRWPREPMGRAVLALLRGELSWEAFNEIVERKKREAQA